LAKVMEALTSHSEPSTKKPRPTMMSTICTHNLASQLPAAAG
jgi:hypothetical protein